MSKCKRKIKQGGGQASGAGRPVGPGKVGWGELCGDLGKIRFPAERIACAKALGQKYVWLV